MATPRKPARGGKTAPTTIRKKKVPAKGRSSKAAPAPPIEGSSAPIAVKPESKSAPVASAPPVPISRAVPVPVADVSDFSAGIFEVEERLFEPQLAPAVSVVEPTVDEHDDEPIIVEPIPERLKNDDEDNLGNTVAEQSSSRTTQSDTIEPHGRRPLDIRRGPETPGGAEAESKTAETPGGQPGSTDAENDKGGQDGRGRRRRGSRGRRGGRRGRGDESQRPEGDEVVDDKRRPEPRRAAPPADAEESARFDDAAAEWDDRAVSEDERPHADRGDDEVDHDTRAQAEPLDTARREMLINVSDSDEVRIALLRDGRLDELYIERAASVSNVGNIYKGRVTNVEPSIQAAFVDFGLPMQGFLHISDLHPNYFPESKGEPELVGRKTPRRQRPPIQSCLKRGQEVIVQVIKEGVGTKGPTLSTYISLPGRFLVMMPSMEQLGVSRKIEDEDTRRKVRSILNQLSLPKGFGFIVRTAGIDRHKKDLQRDLNYLCRLWEKVQVRTKKEPAPATLYKESDLVIRTIRDVYDSNYQRIIVDNVTVGQRVKEFLQIASPQAEDVVEQYEDSEPLFHRYGIESEIDKLYSKHVPLVCGGSLVIEQTEALVAIDVNSGRFRVHDNPEETAYRVNLEAADEIARQLRLRDLGGLIICDFIDMMAEKHRRAVERRLSDALRKHKERAKLLRISRFGILEMTRQRQRPSFAKSMFMECPRCTGSGRVKATETLALDVMRDIRLASQREGVSSIDAVVGPAVANDLLNRKRHYLTDLERAKGQVIRIHADPTLGADEVRISCTDRRGREVPTGGNADTGHRAPASAPAGGANSAQSSGGSGKQGGASNGGRRGGGRRRRGRGR